jgi:hypothetical protein
MAVLKKTKTSQYYDPLSREDRIEALLSTYTSEERECPFYTCDSQNVRSKCLLDPTTWRIWDCRGLPFFQGLCCEYVLNAKETNSTEHLK